MTIRRVTCVAATAAGALALGAAPAAADHATPALKSGLEECGTAVIQTSWPSEDHRADGARLVVDAGGEVSTAEVGEAFTVEVPDGAGDVEVRYRVWGGGERDYDVPALDDLDAMVAHVEEDGGDPLAADAPGAAWSVMTVTGCEPDEGGEGEGEGEGEGNGEGEGEGNGEGEGGESDDWADFIAALDPAPDGVHPGQFCKDADAYSVLRYSEDSVIQCLYDEDSDRHHWVEVHDFADLVEPPKNGKDDEDDGDEQNAGGGGGLPVTGAALGGLVAAGVAAAGGGGAALYFSRKRKAKQE